MKHLLQQQPPEDPTFGPGAAHVEDGGHHLRLLRVVQHPGHRSAHSRPQLKVPYARLRRQDPLPRQVQPQLCHLRGEQPAVQGRTGSIMQLSGGSWKFYMGSIGTNGIMRDERGGF